jgi:hypothetical protein
MNKFIAVIFSEILSIIHIVVIGLLIYVSFEYHQNRKILLSDTFLAEYIKTTLGFYLIIFAILIFYVLVIGTVSTLVAINQNLSEINKKIIEYNHIKDDIQSIENQNFQQQKTLNYLKEKFNKLSYRISRKF